jgi:GntR family transcriptional regulator
VAVPLLSGAPVSRGSALPLHAQCRARIHALIDGGKLPAGTRLPPERQLAAAWGISLAPVRQAILGLVTEGYLRRVRGSGTYVRAVKVEKKLSILSSFTESLHATGAPAEVRLLSCERAPAPAAVREALATTRRSLLRIERLGLLDGEPVAHVIAYLAPGVARGVTGRRLQGASLYELLAHEGVEPARADSVIEVVRVNEIEAGLLGLERGAPALAVAGTTFDGAGGPVQSTRVLYRADRFRFSLESHRRADAVVHVIAPEEGEQ